MSELIAVSAMIGDRSYRIKIPAGEEEVVRKTLKTINEKIVEFKKLYGGKDMQDYVAMVLAWYAVEQNAPMAAGIDQENISGQLDSIERMLDNQLNGS